MSEETGRSEEILVTGAGGEIGRPLIEALARKKGSRVVALDLEAATFPVPSGVTWMKGDVADPALINRLGSDHQLFTIFHLAAILSTGGERAPERAHHVNVDGSFNILSLASRQSERRGAPVKVIFPSTIAVYGIPSVEEKSRAGKVKEHQYLNPITMYGSNKLYVEHLGRYYTRHYRVLEATPSPARIDFRALRFPGLISAETVPTGGTSDYGPEMLHAAAQGKPYECFVSAEARLPFMAMPDAVTALLGLAAAPREALRETVYNVTSFSLSAEEFRAQVMKYFPSARIGFKPDVPRASIVASWPGDMDDSSAQRDWSWRPTYDLERAFGEYLVPQIARRYGAAPAARVAPSCMACANHS